MKEKTFYAVATTIFDDGRAIVRHAGIQRGYIKPDNKFTSGAHANRYIDWFDSYEAAQQFIEENTL